MKRKALAQIVITSADKRTFKVAIFDNKECLDDEAHDEAETVKLVTKLLKRLRVVRGR